MLICTTVSAASPDNSIGAAKLLDKNDVLKIVDINIQDYLKTDLQTIGKTITASPDFINLYDLNSNLFAYMVPLMEKGNEIGYITVGAIDDAYATYEINIQNNIVTEIKGK